MASRSPMSMRKRAAPVQTATANWCVNTIPATILSQVPMQIGAPLQERHQLSVLQRRLQGRRADEAPLVGRR